MRHPRLPILYGVAGPHVFAWNIVANGLKSIGKVDLGGIEPAHAVIDATGRHLAAVYYGSGNVIVVRLETSGALGQVVERITFSGSGPVLDRQSAAHPHHALFAPLDLAGDTSIEPIMLVTDLGSDVIHAVRLGLESGRLLDARPSVGRLNPGTGPRHAALGADGTLVVTGELSATIASSRVDAVTGEMGQWRYARSSGAPAAIDTYPSDVVIDNDRALAYVANRGPDTIAIFQVGEHDPTRLSEVGAGGQRPQHLLMTGRHLVVANRDSGDVVKFELDAIGRPTSPSLVAQELPAPTCLAIE